jgi:hypothetical protein
MELVHEMELVPVSMQSTNLYDIYLYSLELLMMDRKTVPNM